MEPETVVTVLDRIGIFAFAFAGAQAASGARFDVFGVLVLGLVTATGGGVIRDVVLQRDASLQWAVLIGALVSAGLRLASVFFRLHLPVPGAPPPSE